MPKYYFNLFNDLTAIDGEGLELADVAAAEAQARIAAAQIIAEKIAAGERVDLRHRIEIADEDRQVVFVLCFRDLVETAEATDDR